MFPCFSSTQHRKVIDVESAKNHRGSFTTHTPFSYVGRRSSGQQYPNQSTSWIVMEPFLHTSGNATRPKYEVGPGPRLWRQELRARPRREILGFKVESSGQPESCTMCRFPDGESNLMSSTKRTMNRLTHRYPQQLSRKQKVTLGSRSSLSQHQTGQRPRESC